MNATSLRRVLLPIDGSEPATQAVRQAVAVARWSGGKVTAIHVCPPPLPEEPLTFGAESTLETERAMGAWLTHEACAAGAASPIDLIVKVGSPARQTIETATSI